ncbi:MAG TPA: thioredoxin family protein [Chloroflexota bacterium]|nr:thioredoxin family protein [Chloroflexota bacterium]
MSLISKEDREFLVDHFAKELTAPVKIVYFTQPSSNLLLPGGATSGCEYCEDTQGLLEEVASLSDKITLEVHDFATDKALAEQYGVNKVPATVILGAARGKIRFFGIPSGYEFGSLIEGIVDISRGTTDLSDATKKLLDSVTEDLHIQVFVTPTCPYCPSAARMAQKMAIENEHVIADTVEATEFPQMSRQYKVQGVPKIVVNEDTQFVGALPEPRYLGEVMKAVKA